MCATSNAYETVRLWDAFEVKFRDLWPRTVW
jgi:hypothetical protein